MVQQGAQPLEYKGHAKGVRDAVGLKLRERVNAPSSRYSE